MKLRIKDDAIRFRVPPSEVSSLMREGSLTSQVRFSLHPHRALRYSLVLDDSIAQPTISFIDDHITARVPRNQAARWACDRDEVTISGESALGASATLALLIEKDFACLDRSDEENVDTYPNPSAGQNC